MLAPNILHHRALTSVRGEVVLVPLIIGLSNQSSWSTQGILHEQDASLLLAD